MQFVTQVVGEPFVKTETTFRVLTKWLQVMSAGINISCLVYDVMCFSSVSHFDIATACSMSGLILGLRPANEIWLLCNDVSDWLDASLKSALVCLYHDNGTVNNTINLGGLYWNRYLDTRVGDNVCRPQVEKNLLIGQSTKSLLWHTIHYVELHC